MPSAKYPGRPCHETPFWIKDGFLFHIRIRASPKMPLILTEPELAANLLQAARHYHESQKWQCHLFLLMPDHLHALLMFPPGSRMVTVIGNWKRITARLYSIRWQSNFFDHRIRNDSSAAEKWLYIRNNPVAKALCKTPDEWPYWWGASKH